MEMLVVVTNILSLDILEVWILFYLGLFISQTTTSTLKITQKTGAYYDGS